MSLTIPHSDRERVSPITRWRGIILGQCPEICSTFQSRVNQTCDAFHHQLPLNCVHRPSVFHPSAGLLCHPYPSRRTWLITSEDRIIPWNFWIIDRHSAGPVLFKSCSIFRVEGTLSHQPVLFHPLVRSVPHHRSSRARVGAVANRLDLGGVPAFTRMRRRVRLR